MCGGLPSSTEYFVSASDNCDSNVEITVTASVEGLGCNVVRTITWTATDDCGNSTSATRTFTTQDNTAPTMVGVPADAVMQCGQNVPNAVVEAIDNCDTDVTISFETVTVPAQCGYSLVRKWTAVDDCGNTTSASQTTTFEDTTDPVLVGLPSNTSVDCGSVPSGDDFDVTGGLLYSIPIDPKKIVKNRKKILALVRKLEKEQRKNPLVTKYKGKWMGNYDMSRCRSVTDEIDRLILDEFGLLDYWPSVLYVDQTLAKVTGERPGTLRKWPFPFV
jgi:hypothetical protein